MNIPTSFCFALAQVLADFDKSYQEGEGYAYLSSDDFESTKRIVRKHVNNGFPMASSEAKELAVADTLVFLGPLIASVW